MLSCNFTTAYAKLLIRKKKNNNNKNHRPSEKQTISFFYKKKKKSMHPDSKGATSGSLQLPKGSVTLSLVLGRTRLWFPRLSE